MALLRYLEKVPTESDRVPNPRGPLEKVLPPEVTRSANELVREVLTPIIPANKRGKYQVLSATLKAKIGKYAAENGNTAASRHFSKDLEKPLSEGTIRGFKSKYLDELSRKRKANEDLTTESLPDKKRGRPLLLGEELDHKVQAYVQALRDSGGSVSSAIVSTAAKGILLKVKKMLPEYGGQATLTKAWAQSLLNCMGFVKCRGTTKCSISAENFESLREEYLNNVSTTVIMEDIPPEMVLNWDQTGLRIIPSKSWTMEKRGSRRVELKGIDDKRQITATLCGTSTGVFLPPQIIYQGKTNRCHPTIKFPADWCITHSPNHWANEHTTLDSFCHIFGLHVVNQN